MTKIREMWRSWDHFWFGCEEFFSLGVFRAMIASAGFLMYFMRFLEWEIFFGQSSLISSDIVVETITSNAKPLFFWFPVDHQWIVGLQILYLVALVFVAIGLWSRPWAWVAWFLHCAFLQRNYAVIYGADTLFTCWLLYLGLAESDRAFSLKSWFLKKRQKIKKKKDILTSVGVRLMQIQLCVVYAYAGLEKMKGDYWWDGTAVWRIFGNPQMSTGDYTFFKFLPWLIPLLTYGTLFFEIYFPFLIFSKKTRYWTMLLGLSFHLGITAVMGIPFFSVYMAVGYVLFIPSNTLKKWLGKVSLKLS